MANMFFVNVVCIYPGSCHDFFILRQSNIHGNFENGHYDDEILLGDSGYPLESWLMTPIAAPSSDQIQPNPQKMSIDHRRVSASLKIHYLIHCEIYWYFFKGFWSIEAKMARNKPHWEKIMLHFIKNMQDIYVLLHSSSYMPRAQSYFA